MIKILPNISEPIGGAMLRSRRGSRASIVNVFTYSTIFEDEEGSREESHVLLQPLLDHSSLPLDNDYSVSEMSESFTIVQTGEERKLVLKVQGEEEDTDVEEDDEFDEYSEVTFEQPKPVVPNVRVRKNTVFGHMAPNMATNPKKSINNNNNNNNNNNGEKHNHGGGLCHCAETYR